MLKHIIATSVGVLFALGASAQSASAQEVLQWETIKPSTTGIPGELMQLMKFDPQGNLWVAARWPFWRETGIAMLPADDVPLDIEIHTEAVEPTVVGDDAVGIDDGAGEDDVAIHEDGAASMIDEGRGHAEEGGVDFIGDDELGIDPIPTEVDDGGHEGLDDPAGERVEEREFPPLDGAEDDDESDEPGEVERANARRADGG